MSFTILHEEAMTLADDDCASWLKHCNAECCRHFTIRDIGQDLSLPEMILPCVLDPDMKKYYLLHGCRVGHGFIAVPNKYVTRTGGDHLMFRRTCDYLTEELKCRHHGTKEQPRVCRELTMPRLRDKKNPLKNVAVTPNCLFHYKLELEAVPHGG